MKTSLNKLKTFNFLKFSSRGIKINQNFGFYTPDNSIESVPEIKTWLNRSKPRLLCIYFTNDWNPVCKKAIREYPSFAGSNSQATHLLVNTDKFPKLRWYFDAKMEPCMKLFYYGLSVSTKGGANFQQFSEEIKRVNQFLSNEYNQFERDSKEYEQPYYHWESELKQNGNEAPLDSSQSFRLPLFRGFMTFFNKEVNEHQSIHIGIRK